MREYEWRKEKLLKLMEEYTKEDVLIAYSGGVDSSLILNVAAECAKANGTTVHGATLNTDLQPLKDLPDAVQGARQAGVVHHVIEIEVLANAGIEHNPENRCYLCKKFLFTQLISLAETLGISTVMEGSNEDDQHVYRPGLEAVKELGIKSPLTQAGMTKQMVRNMAGELGISSAQRPASPCMATRFPYGTLLDKGKIRCAREAEDALKDMGFFNVRCRIYGDSVRLEVDRKDLTKAAAMSETITRILKKLGFQYIMLDLEGFRSGSMDREVFSK